MTPKILILALSLAASTAAPALADPPPWAPAHGRRAHEAEARRDYDRHRDGYDRGDYARYDSRGRYLVAQPLRSDDYVWRGSDGRVYCKRRNGTTGLVIGGAVGALLGRELDGGRNRTLGTVLGAAGGALLGREIDRGGLKCR